MMSASASSCAGQLVPRVPEQADGQAAATSDSVAGAGSVDKTPVKRANCAMECGARLPISEMYKSNSRAMPLCHPCFNAKRALHTVANKSPAAKEALAKMQECDPEAWKARVRSCRILDSGVTREGVSTAVARRQELQQHSLSTALVMMFVS